MTPRILHHSKIQRQTRKSNYYLVSFPYDIAIFSTDMLVFMPLPWDLIYHNLKSDSVSPPTVFFFFKIVLAVLGPLHFQINFRTNVSVSTKKKKACWDFAWDYVEVLGGEGGELPS